MDQLQSSAWRMVFEHVIATEKARLGLELDRDIAQAWGLEQSVLSTMRHELRKSHLRETWAIIDQGLRATGRIRVWDGWTKRLYDLCHPPSPQFASEVTQHLASIGLLDERNEIRTSAGVIRLASVQVNGQAHVCRRVGILPSTYEGDPATITEPDAYGEFLCSPVTLSDTQIFGYRIQDDSMAPRYLPGDIAIVASGRDVEPGQPVVYKVTDEPIDCRTFKNLGDRFEFVPKNPAYERIAYSKADVEWLYPVVAMARTEQDAPTQASEMPV